MMPKEQPKAFGIPLTPEFLLKFAALIFSMGMLYQRINGLEEKIDILLSHQNQRISALETFINRR